MRKIMVKLLFCSVFIFLMTLVIVKHELSQSVVALNQTNSQVIQRETADELINNTKEILIIDVRDRDEYEKNHIRNAVNIPCEELEQHIEELMPYQDKPIIIYCHRGKRSRLVGDKLEKLGFTKLYVIQDDME